MSHKTLRLVIDLTYDPDTMHGDDAEGIDWFFNDILMRRGSEEALILHCNEIGDEIGTVKVISINNN